MKKMKQGFTLVEIMIVVAIIGLLAAIAIPSFMKSRATSRQNSCINNLRIIDAAKEQYAMDENADNSAPSEAAITPYMKSLPICPNGGTTFGNSYSINAMNVNPTCLLTNATHKAVL